MKVVILHQHFKSPAKGGAIRSYYLAKALVGQTIDVTVIAGYAGKQYVRENTEGFTVCYLPVDYDNRFGFSARIRSFLKYVWEVIKRPGLFKNADVCYAISTPLTTGLAAIWIKWWYRIPFIFEVGDLWPDAPIQLGFVKNPVLKWMLFRLEKTIYQSAQSIVGLSPAIRNTVQTRVPLKQVHLIPNMADTEFYRPEPKNEQTAQRLGLSGKFVVSYLGAIGFANGLDYYLECARASERAGLPVHFLLCGDGAMLDNLKNSMSRLNLRNFSFIPFQNREGVREIMNVTDAALICYRQVRVLETGSPNKYFDALAAGKLVIINFNGWIREEMEKHQCGIFVDPRHPTDFVKKITPFVEDVEKLRMFQKVGRTLAENTYSRKILGKRFAGVFRDFRV